MTALLFRLCYLNFPMTHSYLKVQITIKQFPPQHVGLESKTTLLYCVLKSGEEMSIVVL